MTEIANAWSTAQQGLAGFEGTIKDAFFANNAAYQNGEVLLMNVVFDASEAKTTEDYTQIYPTGKGWVSMDGGKTAQREDGADGVKFHPQTAYGKLIDRAAKELGLAEVFEKRGMLPTQAEAWKGLRFRWESETTDYNIKGEKHSSTRLYPVEYLGDTTESGGAAEGKVPASSETSTSEVGTDLRSQVEQIAAEMKDEQSFRDAAIDIPDVVKDDALLNDIVQGNIWKKVHA